MDLGSALSAVGAAAAQQVEQARLEFTLAKVKDCLDLEASTVARLLASLPSLSPAGTGGKVDLSA